jgi:hypothetical protein
VTQVVNIYGSHITFESDLCPGMLHHDDWQIVIDVSKECSAFFFRIEKSVKSTSEHSCILGIPESMT